jgi:hypothetical protein
MSNESERSSYAGRPVRRRRFGESEPRSSMLRLRNVNLGVAVRSGVRTNRRIPLVFLTLLLAIASVASAATMPVSEVRKGMKGYGLTVFEGNRIEKFDVEILGVLHNIGPSQDLILARVDSAVVQRAGVIAGMSGSPIYIDGKVIGALAYSWQFAKEPVAGITPIDEMLRIPNGSAPGTTPSAGATPASAGGGAMHVAPRLNAVEFLTAITNGKTEEVFEKMTSGFAAQQASTMSGARPIATPLSLSSFSPDTITRFGKYLDAMNFVAVPSGSTSTGNTATSVKAKFAPGDPIGAVLLNGDFTVAATGTVTHIEGDRIYAFGHPFLDMGEISFPMAQSEIVTVMPSLANSFKFANTGAIVGAFTQDRSVGIMGTAGTSADMIPVELKLEGSGLDHTYHVNVVRHSQLSPLILAMAADSVVANAQRAAGERTVVLDAEIKLKGSDPIHLREGWAGAQARSAIPAYLAVVSGYLMSNEFRDATIESVKIRLRHDDQLKIAKVVEASIVPPESGRITPGDTVTVRALLKPFRGEAFVEKFDVQIPDAQLPGSAYLLVGSGTLVNQIDFMLVPPDPRTLEQVVGVLERLRPSTDLTLGLYSSTDGAVTAGVYLPNLPPSMRAVVTADTSNGAQAPVKYHAAVHQARSLAYIVDGAVKIDLDIKPQI